MITLLRLGHRLGRDSRVTTHCGLVARAFGAGKIILSGDYDKKIVDSLKGVSEQWGGDFDVEYDKQWMKIIKRFKDEGAVVVHLTMYGIGLDEGIAGLVERLKSYDDVRAYDKLGSGFTLARAAFALAGFHPDFNGGGFQSLEEQLKAMGGGVEISMLAATPKGSGLGTSSILAATILGVLSDFAGLSWDKVEVTQRTLALEQMLTSGGGWQDQVGGVFPGIKLVKTVPGLNRSQIGLKRLPWTFPGLHRMFQSTMYCQENMVIHWTWLF